MYDLELSRKVLTLVAKIMHTHLKHECAARRVWARNFPLLSLTVRGLGTATYVFSLYSQWALTQVLGYSANKPWPL